MAGVFSYLLTFFGVIFWFFRVIATLLYQLDVSFFATPLNVNIEIVVLFATLPCILLVFKRNIVGAAAYFGIYAAYFGATLYDVIVQMQETGITIVNTSNFAILVCGVLIPMLTFFDILINKNRTGFGTNKDTDWYYKNEKYDRELDERADKNQYRL